MPAAHRVGKVPLEIQGLRRGEVGLEALRAVVGVDGGDDAALRPALLRQILIQDILQIIGGGGLALGAVMPMTDRSPEGWP